MNDMILVIDDEMDFLDSVKRGLISSGIREVRVESDPRIAAASVQQGDRYAVALIDITMPWINGVQLLEIIKSVSPDTECIMVTAINDARMAVECLQKGAYDYLTKPVSRDELVSKINRALERRRLLEVLSVGKTGSLPQIKHKDAFAPIVTQSEKMLRLLKEAELHAGSNVPALITGESGTGKELLARAIHRSSPRASFPFTSINMASLTGSLFDAEFFGHTKGRLHRGGKGSCGIHRALEPRNTVSGRDRGSAPGLPGKAAPRSAGRRNHQARHQHCPQGGCAIHRGDQCRSGQVAEPRDSSARICITGSKGPGSGSSPCGSAGRTFPC